MDKVSKTIKISILIIIGIGILIGLAFVYKYAIYEPKEDWDNIAWVKYKNTTNWLLPHWQVDVPTGWKSGKTGCCSNVGLGFIGWTSDLLGNSILNEHAGGGYLVDLLSMQDRDRIIAKLSIPTSLERVTEKEIVDLENNFLYQKETKNNLTIFIEKKKNTIKSELKKLSLTMFITEINVDRSIQAYIISGKNKFEITLYYKTNSDPAKVYDAFSHIVNSFEIIE